MSGVRFDVPIEVAFDYLVDPANRPAWQSSLRRVEDLSDATLGLGQRWTDVTSPGLRPEMETTEFERPHRWTERGTWRGISAELTLLFDEIPGGCTVTARARVHGHGLLRPVGPFVAAAAGFAVPGDLKRAAKILTGP